LGYFFQALITSPIYMEWMPAGKLACIFVIVGAKIRKSGELSVTLPEVLISFVK
jgi:hypothetical protein